MEEYQFVAAMQQLRETVLDYKGNTNHSTANGQFISGTSTGAGGKLPESFGKGATFAPLKTSAGDVVSFGGGVELRANPHQFAMTASNGTKYRATQIEPLRTKTENYTAQEVENNAMRASSMAKAIGASDIIHPAAVAKDDKGTSYLVEDGINTTGAHMPGSEEGVKGVDKMSGDDALRNLAVQYVTGLGDRKDGNNIRVEQDGTVSHTNIHHGPNAKNPIDDTKMPDNNFLLKKKKDEPITHAGLDAIKKIVEKSKEAIKAAEPYTSKQDLATISKRFDQLSNSVSTFKKRGLAKTTTVQDFFSEVSKMHIGNNPSIKPYTGSPKI